MILSSAAYGLPQGGQVAAGNATIASSGTSAMVTQGSGRAVIDWRSFDVGAGEKVEFKQPSTSSVTLNRIHDQKPSEILGRISANGQVILSNPNGMIFGKDSRIDVAGLVATSASAGTDAFMRGGEIALDQAGRPDAKIVNHGTVTAKEAGLVALVAPSAENTGTITARLGLVQLAGAETATVDLFGDGLVAVAVTGKAASTSVTQSGRITAGRIALTAADAAHLVESVVSTTGVLEASDARVEKGGTVVFGGRIELTGRDVTVGKGAELHADGRNGGGIIKIGGGWQGRGTIPNARNTTIAKGAVVTANAREKGQGGTIAVWADQTTQFDGTILAKGGPNDGDGGNVETSGQEQLGVTGLVDASAPKGKAGNWLLDPRDVYIRSTGVASIPPSGGIYDAPNDNQSVLDSSISTALSNGNNVTITTGTTGAQNGSIVLDNATITKSGGSDATLTLKAVQTVSTIGTNSITSTSGKLHTILWSDAETVPNNDGYISLTNTTISTNGGDIVLGGGLDDGANGGTAADGRPDNLAWGNATIDDGVTLNTSTLSSSAGNITLRGHGRNNAATASQIGVQVVGISTVQTTGEGAIMLLGTGGSGTNTNYGVYVTGAGTLLDVVDGNISLTGQGNGTNANNYGVLVNGDADIISTGTGVSAGNITLNGTGGFGTTGNIGTYLSGTGSSITTIDGDISLIGQGGTGVSTSNNGTQVSSGAKVISTGSGASAGNITLTGTGGNGTSNNYGIYIASTNTAITASDGDISLSGTGGTGGTQGHKGVYLVSGATVNSLGTGSSASKINIYGTGGSGQSGCCNEGVQIQHGAFITTIDGDVTVTGQSLSSSHSAIMIDAATRPSGIVSTGAADITLNGIASSSSDIYVSNSTASAFTNILGGPTNTGSITFNANSLNTGTLTPTIQTQGSILFKPRTAGTPIGVSGGTCGSSCTLNVVDTFLAGLQPDADGNGIGSLVIGDAAAGTGTVDINGWDFSGKTYDVEVYGGTVDLTGGPVTWNGGNDILLHSRTGDLVIDQDLTRSAGTVGDGTLTLKASGNIATSGTRTISAATSGATGKLHTILWSDADNSGDGYVRLTSSGTTITSNGGDIVLGGGLDDGSNNGTALDGRPDGYARASATGTTTGVYLQAANLNSGTGSILLRGIGSENSACFNNCRGIIMVSSQLTASGSGDIYLHGIGGGNTGALYTAGIQTHSGTQIHTDAGSIHFKGEVYIPGPTNSGISIGPSVTSTVSGDVLFEAPGGLGWYNSGSNAVVNSGRNIEIKLDSEFGATSIATSLDMIAAGNIAIKPITAGTPINVAVPSGELFIQAAYLNRLQAGTIVIGDATSGLIRVNPYATWASRASSGVSFLSGPGGITFTPGAHDFGTRSLTATASGPLTANGAITAGDALVHTTGATSDITIGAAGSLTASGTGDALTLASGRNFINNAGAGALSATAGRWLVYSASPSTNANGGLLADFARYGCEYGACSGFTPGLDGFLYREVASGGSSGGGSGGGPAPTLPVAPPTSPVPPIREPGSGQPPAPATPVITTGLPDFIRKQDIATRIQVNASPRGDAFSARSTAPFLAGDGGLEDGVTAAATQEETRSRISADDRRRRWFSGELYTVSPDLARDLEGE